MDIMVYVLEMLYAGLLDTDFADSHTEGVHQVDGDVYKRQPLLSAGRPER